MNRGLSERLRAAVTREVEHSADLIDQGIPVSRRVLVLGAAADGMLELGELPAGMSDRDFADITGALVTGAMLNSVAREFVITDPADDGTFTTYGISRDGHGGIVASLACPFDGSTASVVCLPDEAVAVLRSWLPDVPAVLSLNDRSDIYEAMLAVAPGGQFEVTQAGPLVSGFSFEIGLA